MSKRDQIERERALKMAQEGRRISVERREAHKHAVKTEERKNERKRYARGDKD